MHVNNAKNRTRIDPFLKLLNRVTATRLWIYGILSSLIVVGIITKGIFWHRVSQYQEGKSRLEKTLQEDDRFRDVRIFFFSTRPSISILAPSNLPFLAKQDLERMVNTAFTPLSVQIQYAGTEFFNTNSESQDRTAVTP
jgi:hypothetical protein